jgi:hypothetical protein
MVRKRRIEAGPREDRSLGLRASENGREKFGVPTGIHRSVERAGDWGDASSCLTVEECLVYELDPTCSLRFWPAG